MELFDLGDGLPSIAPIDDDSMSDASDMIPGSSRKQRNMFNELKQISSDYPEDEEDLDQIPELRTTSGMDSGSESMADNYAASSDSLASLIPPEKKAAMNNFELTLKEMIQEAREMARTPVRDFKEETPPPDLSRYEQPDPYQQRQQQQQQSTRRDRSPWAERRSMKSPSVLSTTESVVSVIEAPKGNADMLPMPAISVTQEDGSQYRSRTSLNNDFDPNTVVLQPLAPVRAPKSREMSPNERQRRLQQKQTDPSVIPAVRYEEIITEAPRLRRGSSQLSGGGSQVDIFSREPMNVVAAAAANKVTTPTINDTADYDTAESLFGNGFVSNSSRNATPSLPQPNYQAFGVGINGGRNGTLVQSRPLNLSNQSLNRPLSCERQMQDTLNQFQSATNHVDQFQHQQMQDQRQPIPLKPLPKFIPKNIQISIDPTKRPPPEIGRDPNSAYTAPPTITLPQNLPIWFLITYTYSAVLIMILLIANVTPDGRLYIHFTAFWSLILYFLMDDETNLGTDPLDSVMEGFVGKK